MSQFRILPYGLLFSAVACSPEAGPQQATGDVIWFEGARLIVGDDSAPIENSAFLVEAEGRTAVLELHASDVELVKVWIDGRGGRVPKVEPNVLRAIVDEAHASGIRVVAHVGTTSALADGKDILKAGVDGFAHRVHDRDVDDEYIALVRQHPEVWSIPNLPGNPLTMEDLPWSSEQFPLQCRNLRRNQDAGMILGMGTDSGTSVAWTAHMELRDMVTCGLSPMEAIIAATWTNAEILGLDGLGMVLAGKSASFVVLDGNPLGDINNTRRIFQVYLRGEEIDREALRAKFMDGVM